VRGAPIRYTEAELRFLESRQAMSRRALHAAFVEAFGRAGVTVDHIKQLCSRRGWRTDRRAWSTEDDVLVRERYPDTPTPELARRLGRTVSATYNRAVGMGLRKSAAYLASPAACRLRRGDNVGAGTRFTPGHAPANKGLRRPGWSPGRMKDTQFRKGERRGVAVKKYKPIGTERLSKEGYLERKIHDGLPLQSRWRAVQRIRWEAIHGPTPKGMVLKCLDGNRLNTEPANWTLIPRALLPRLVGGRLGRLGYDEAPPELKPTILAVAKLEHAARTRTKARAS
jgi:hypothetical protein